MKLTVTDDDGILLDSIRVTPDEWKRDIAHNAGGLIAALQVGSAVLDAPFRYQVGDVDPTPNDADWCGAETTDEGGGIYGCTWPPNHDHPQHVAGDGEAVCWVWDVDRS